MIVERIKSAVGAPELDVPAGERIPTIAPSAQLRFSRADFFEESAGFHRGPQKRSGLKLALWTWLSAGIDTLVLISMSCAFAIIFSLLLQTSARKVMTTFIEQPTLSHLLVGFFLACFWLYLIVMRVFMGASIGESACHLRLGQPQQRRQTGYVMRVMARTSIILGTGIVILPLLSLAFKRDLVGALTGIKIYSLK